MLTNEIPFAIGGVRLKTFSMSSHNSDSGHEDADFPETQSDVADDANPIAAFIPSLNHQSGPIFCDRAVRAFLTGRHSVWRGAISPYFFGPRADLF